MTDSKNEQQTPRQNKLSSQKENFDFDLVDVQVTPDQINPAPSPLNNFIDEEDAIDRLFMNAHFDENTVQQVTSENNDMMDDYDSIDRMLSMSNARTDDFDAHTTEQKSSQKNNTAPAEVVSEPAPIIPPAQVIPEIKTTFYVDYFDKRKKLKTTQPEPVSAAEVYVNPAPDKPSSVDDRSQESMIPEKNSTPPPQQPTEDSNAPTPNGAGMAVAVLSQFKSKQESINKQQEKLIQDFSQKIKSATKVTYTAIFFGVVALAAATTLGVMLLKTKSEVSDLMGTTTALKDNIKNIAKASPYDLEGTDPAIDQLNQKVEGVMEQLKEQSQVSNSGLKNEVTALQNKVSQLEKTAALTKATANKPLESSQPVITPTVTTAATPVVEKKPVLEPTVKVAPPSSKPLKNKNVTVATDTAHVITPKPLKKPIVEPVAPVTAKPTAKPQVAPITAKPQMTGTPKKANDMIDKTQAVLPANDINNLIKPVAAPLTPQPAINNTVHAPQTPPTPSKPAPTNTAHAPQTGSGWTVNLGSSNKQEEAKKTAAKFSQQGIPVTISPVTVKNETRYRLQVKGFKNKEEAKAFADKAESTLKLKAWINP